MQKVGCPYPIKKRRYGKTRKRFLSVAIARRTKNHDVEIWEVSEMDIVVQNSETYEDVAVLHSYEDAENYIMNHDEELRIEF